METWFVIIVGLLVFYSAGDLAGALIELKYQEPDGTRRKNLYISASLRITVIAWGLFSLAFATGGILMDQMFRVVPALALCLIMTDEGTLKWLDNKTKG
jgi:hypothetical protein